MELLGMIGLLLGLGLMGVDGSPTGSTSGGAFNGNVLSLNSTIKQQFVDAHNKFRAGEPAVNMRALSWDDQLEKMAKDWARRCEGTHRPTEQRMDIRPYWYVGENIYWDSTFDDKYKAAKKSVKWWFDEKPYYVYSKPGTCTGGIDCLHYGQLVWADTCTVGCAVATCDKLKNTGKVKSGFIVVCVYGPGGNVIGQKPYEKGVKKCSKCNGKCVNNLCQDKCPGDKLLGR